MRIRVEEYVRNDDSNPYRTWFNDLDIHAATKVATALVRLEMGNTSSLKWFAGMGECRIDWGPGYRIYLAKDGEALIVLFGGGTKKTQPSDIKRAKALHDEYKQRKKAAMAIERKALQATPIKRRTKWH